MTSIIVQIPVQNQCIVAHPINFCGSHGASVAAPGVNEVKLSPVKYSGVQHLLLNAQNP